MNARDLFVADTRLEQPLYAAAVSFPAAKRSYVEAAGFKRGLQTEIVDLRIVGERRNCGIGMQRNIRKTLLGGEGRTRIDDFHVEAGDPGHRRKRLADMNRANHHKARLR